MIATRLVYILMPLSIVLSFLWAPPAAVLGETSRIIYYHVPLAWISVLAFAMSGYFAVRYLLSLNRTGGRGLDEKSHVAASMGLYFTVLTVMTGSVWAKISWGSFWNWDPRETTIMALLLIYIAYMSLHSSLKNNENRGKICSSYLLLAAATVPFFVFIIPRLYPTLHPDPILNRETRIFLDVKMRITLVCTVVSFTLLYFYLYQIRIKMLMLQSAVKVAGDEKK